MKKRILSIAFIACFIITHAQNVEWAKQGKGPFIDRGNSICRDDAGFIYITGRFKDSIRFNNILLQSGAPSITSSYIVKYDTLGNVVWAKNSSLVPGPSNLGGGGITSDGSGYLYAWYNGNYSVQKLDLNGNIIWNKDLFDYSSGSPGINDIKVAGNHLYLTGYFSSHAIYYNSGADSIPAMGASDVFIFKTDLNLNVEWAKSEGGTGNDTGRGIYATSSEEIITTGSFSDTINFGTHQLISKGNTDIYIVKYDNTGNVVWANGYGNTNFDLAARIIADNSGDLYITGRFADSLNVTGTTLMAQGTTDAFIAKFTTAGTPVWLKSISGTGADEEADITIEGNKLAFICTTVGNVIAGTQAATAVGGLDICVGEADLNGNIAWIKLMGSTGMDEGSGICQIDNSIYFTGSFNGTATFEDHSLTSQAQWDAITGKIGYSITTAVSDISANTQTVTVYPNPANNLLYVDYNGNVDVTITDYTGRVIVEAHNYVSPHDTPIDISGLSKGMYIITIQNETEKFVSRFVKQ